MSTKLSVPVASFLVQQGTNNLGQFTGLSLGPNLVASAQGANLAVDSRMSAADQAKLDALLDNVIVFRPGAPSSGSHVATWAEVEAFIAAMTGDLIVIVDSSLAPAVVPASADTECASRVAIASFSLTDGTTLTLADGGRLKNVAAFREMIVIAAPTVRSPLYFDKPNQVFELRDTTLFEDVGSTKALIEVDVATLVAYCTGQTFLDNTSAPANPLVFIHPGNFFGLTVVDANFATLSPNAIQGDATTSFAFQHDLSIEFVAQNLMLGGVSESRLSFLAAAQPSFGALAARPVTTFTGQMYFDTTLGIPIWWNGAAWVNAAGAAV